ncbi:TadE/TadG family type IV pilus assembly protein [Pseudoneobacillus sp. C159]
MKKLIKFVNNERGNVLVMVTLSFISLLGMAGLGIDAGLMYMTKTHLQKTANAAVLSGAQELTTKEERVKTVVNDILKAHKEEHSLEGLQVLMENKVSIDLKKTVKLTFARLFGFDEVNVRAHAAAGIRPIGRAIGAAPLGVDERVPLEYGTIQKLKVTSAENIGGNFGILALGGPGARTYEENLRYGYREEIKVGMVINTETGNIAGKTETVVKELVDGCPFTPVEAISRNCTRVILIPVYKPNQLDSKQLKSVTITGFAYFYITEPLGKNDTSITGIFIKRAGKGYEEVGSVERGAYKIRITE